MLKVRWCVDLARVTVGYYWNFKKRKEEKQYRNFPILISTYIIGAQKNRLHETAFWAHVTSVKLADKTKRIMLIVRWCVDLAMVIVQVLLEFQHYCLHKFTEAH